MFGHEMKFGIQTLIRQNIKEVKVNI